MSYGFLKFLVDTTTVNLKSIKHPIKRNKTNSIFVQQDYLKIAEWNNLYLWVMYGSLKFLVDTTSYDTEMILSFFLSFFLSWFISCHHSLNSFMTFVTRRHSRREWCLSTRVSSNHGQRCAMVRGARARIRRGAGRSLQSHTNVAL